MKTLKNILDFLYGLTIVVTIGSLLGVLISVSKEDITASWKLLLIGTVSMLINFSIAKIKKDGS